MVEPVAAGDVVQTPLDGEVVIEAEAAAVGADEVIGEKVDDELDEDDEPDDDDDGLGNDVVVVVGSVAAGTASDGAEMVPVVVDADEAEDIVDATLVAAVDAAVPLDEMLVDDELVEAVVVAELVVLVLVVAAAAAAAEAGEHAVMAAAFAAGGPETVPALALVVWVPLAEPPEVLIKTRFRTSAFCQYGGAASITTWYWLSGL